MSAAQVTMATALRDGANMATKNGCADLTLPVDMAVDIADMLAPSNGNSPVTQAEIEHLRKFVFDQGQQLIAMGAALRLLRVYALGVMLFEESPYVRKYLTAWIDDGRWLPLQWPEHMPGVARWLLQVGFAPRNGAIGLPDVTPGRVAPFVGGKDGR